MRRALLLIVAVFFCLGQKGDDGKPRLRASVCENRECTKSGPTGHAPALVRVTITVPMHADNRGIAFGLQCENYEQESRWPLDGANEKIPSWSVMYRDVPVGRCRAAAMLRRTTGDVEARSEQIVIQ